MIPKQHAQKLLGFSLGTLILVGVFTYVYLDYLERSRLPVSPPEEPLPSESVEPIASPVGMEQFQQKMLALFRQDAYYFSLRDAQLYLASYFDYPLLFSADPIIERDLDRQIIPKQLRQQFAQQRILLSDDADVFVRRPGYWWVIVDQKKSVPWDLAFTIARQDELLNVYRNPRDFEDHQLQVDFATLYPENYSEGEDDWSPVPWAELRRFYEKYVQDRPPELERLRFRLASKEALIKGIENPN